METMTVTPSPLSLLTWFEMVSPLGKLSLGNVPPKPPHPREQPPAVRNARVMPFKPALDATPERFSSPERLVSTYGANSLPPPPPPPTGVAVGLAVGVAVGLAVGVGVAPPELQVPTNDHSAGTSAGSHPTSEV